jgi:hypothetical protein
LPKTQPHPKTSDGQVHPRARSLSPPPPNINTNRRRNHPKVTPPSHFEEAQPQLHRRPFSMPFIPFIMLSEMEHSPHSLPRSDEFHRACEKAPTPKPAMARFTPQQEA